MIGDIVHDFETGSLESFIECWRCSCGTMKLADDDMYFPVVVLHSTRNSVTNAACLPSFYSFKILRWGFGIMSYHVYSP